MNANNAVLVRPTSEQVEWADCEIGILVHYDMQVFAPEYDFREQWGWQPDASVFNPSMLDTDQWARTAAAAGAKYALLVAKHCSGFCLWPTAAYDYSVKSSPWKDGKGDIVGDFIHSCKKFGLKPGLYYSCSCNAHLGVDNPGLVLGGTKEEQENYNNIVIQQLTELWGNYGELFEIWFDGGVLPPEMGGPDIAPLLARLQPNANVFQGRKGMRNLLRWAGNEAGKPPYPCWSTASLEKNDFDGTEDCPGVGNGDAFAPIWAPAESDLPNRNAVLSRASGWFWAEGEDGLVQSAGYLFDRYLDSIGCNTNMLVGMVVDNRGLVPDEDVRQFTRFGELTAKFFSEANLLAEACGSGNELTVEIRNTAKIRYIVLMEDIAQGERILQYSILGWNGAEWKDLGGGSCVGHKRIQCMKYPYPADISAVKFVCTKSKAEPVIRKLAVYK